MEFERTLENLEMFGYSGDVYQLFNHTDAEYYRSSITFMGELIKRAMRESDLEPLFEKHNEFENIRITLQNFIRGFTLTNYNEVKYSILKQYLLLTYNFIEASCNKDQEIAYLADHLHALTQYQSSMVDAIHVLRELTKEARGLAQFKPAAFEISQHYLKSIDDRIEGNR